MAERLGPAPGEDASVALAFVNTLTTGPNGSSDEISRPGALAEWLARHSMRLDTCVEQDLAEARHLRDAIRSVLVACGSHSPPAENQVKTINATAARSPGAPRLIVTATTPTNRWSTTNAGIDEALAALARDAIALATSAAASRVRSCAAGDCIRLFLPERSTRTWCSTACGNRVRAARHYAHRTP